MNSYLTNIIHNNMAPKDTIRPRLPGLFETGSFATEPLSNLEFKAELSSALNTGSGPTSAAVSENSVSTETRQTGPSPLPAPPLSSPTTGVSDHPLPKSSTIPSPNTAMNPPVAQPLPEASTEAAPQQLLLNPVSPIPPLLQLQTVQAGQTTSFDPALETFTEMEASLAVVDEPQPDRSESFGVQTAPHPQPTLTNAPASGRMSSAEVIISERSSGQVDSSASIKALDSPPSHAIQPSVPQRPANEIEGRPILPAATTLQIKAKGMTPQQKSEGGRPETSETSTLSIAPTQPAVSRSLALEYPDLHPLLFQPAQPPPAPTIQVNIGRIEVKAKPPASKPRQPRQSPPVMTLDEYLRQRSQGGGR
jgi:hypothetical protein